MKKKILAFTLVEILVVVIVLGLLTSIVVIQVDRSLTRSIERKSTNDILLLNNAVMQFRASYPSVNMSSLATNADEAFALIRPFLGLSSDVDTLSDFNRETAKLHVYNWNSTTLSFSLGSP